MPVIKIYGIYICSRFYFNIFLNLMSVKYETNTYKIFPKIFCISVEKMSLFCRIFFVLYSIQTLTMLILYSKK